MYKTRERAKASNEFEKNLFKLMNNAVFGKTMENFRKHHDIKLVSKWAGRYGCRQYIAKPNFKSRTVFAENLATIELYKEEIKMFKPITIDMAILDSKLTMYNFHYDYIKKQKDDEDVKYKLNAKLLYKDTDSFIYSMETEDFYNVMKRDADRFDTSDFPSDNIFNIVQQNRKIPGLMKGENSGEIMTYYKIK